MQLTSIGDALFTKTQQKVLGLLFGKPDQRYYTNEILRRVGMGRGTVSRELAGFVAAGLLEMSKEGNQNYYQANAENPIYSELVSIVKKSFGVADQIKEKLEPFDRDIEYAFVYGSISKGTESKSSDIDLMIIGQDLSYGAILEALLPLEGSLQREISPTIYGKQDFIDKLAAGSSFLCRVMDQPKIMLKGLENDIRKSSPNNS